MANQYFITFQHVAGSALGITASVSGSVEVDYDTNTILASNLVYNQTVPPGITVPLDNVSFTHDGGTYTISAGSSQLTSQHFNFDYPDSNLAPSSFSSVEIVIDNPSPPPADFSAPLTLTSNELISVVVCFAAGTLIRTPRGDVAVETLQAGDVVVTASGAYRPIKWVGRRVIDCRKYPAPKAVWPIRIAADAIAPNEPSQDLLVSPAHTICVDLIGEMLVHAGNLVNGATIAQIEVDEIDYWHVELESHDLLVANNLASESYLAMANRGFFAERDETPEAGAGRTHDDFCRPVMKDAADLDFLRRRLVARAKAIGWTASRDADLRLVVDGEIILPVAAEGKAAFRLSADARDVRLVSNTFVPDKVGAPDARRLGASLLGLAFVGGGERREIALTDPRLADGLHPEEGQAGAHWRWTKGELRLDPQFYAGLSGDIELHVVRDESATRAWIAPAQTDVRPALRLVKAG